MFIPDLTNKATGAVLVVLIVLYVGTQLASSLMMSSPTMDPTQRKIMLLMPLFFVVFIISFPAGVIVYWVTTNSWTIGQQYVVKRRIGPMTPPVAADRELGRRRRIRLGGRPAGRARWIRRRSGKRLPLGRRTRRHDSRRLKPSEEPTPVAAGRGRGGPPPQSPRKKKKRSGRRR